MSLDRILVRPRSSHLSCPSYSPRPILPHFALSAQYTSTGIMERQRSWALDFSSLRQRPVHSNHTHHAKSLDFRTWAHQVDNQQTHSALVTQLFEPVHR